LGAALAIGLIIQDVESWPERIASVTIEQVNAALSAVANDKRSVTAILLPEEPKK
jgi:zinc protease